MLCYIQLPGKDSLKGTFEQRPEEMRKQTMWVFGGEVLAKIKVNTKDVYWCGLRSNKEEG